MVLLQGLHYRTLDAFLLRFQQVFGNCHGIGQTDCPVTASLAGWDDGAHIAMERRPLELF